MYEQRKRLFLVIAVPYQNLADQWQENLRIFNINSILCYGGEANWREALTDKVNHFKSGVIDFAACVVVDATLSSSSGTFKNIIDSLKPSNADYLMFIGDECHHHGAQKIASALPENAKLRIGLSATPDRGEEDIGNDLINEYYGDVIFKYDLEDALKDDVLTPYDYHLIPVELTVEEAEEYINFSKQISRIIAISGGHPTDDTRDQLNILLSKRSKIVNGCSNKFPALVSLLKTIDEPIPYSLFYCAEGRLDDVNNSEDVEGLRLIEKVSMILHKQNWRSSQFTANENKQRRISILEDFKHKKIHSLVAMKCLDEGVDIPVCSTAFILSSSRKPRQFVQRRGRILRKSPGKEKATIYDFFVTLPLDSVEEVEIARKLMIAEPDRINEFAKLCLNKGSVYTTLRPYLEKYDLWQYVD